MPPGMKPGAPAAMWIWREAPNVWKLRTTTSGQRLVFAGSVAGKHPHRIVGVRATRNELTDQVSLYVKNVVFRFETDGDFDGFDFVTEKEDPCMQFFLPEPRNSVDKIFFGARQVQPKSERIEACP